MIQLEHKPVGGVETDLALRHDDAESVRALEHARQVRLAGEVILHLTAQLARRQTRLRQKTHRPAPLLKEMILDLLKGTPEALANGRADLRIDGKGPWSLSPGA